MWAVTTAAVVLCGVLLQLAQLQPLHLAASPVLASTHHQQQHNRNARSSSTNLKQHNSHNLNNVYPPQQYHWQTQRKRTDEQPPPDEDPPQHSLAVESLHQQFPRPMARSHRANRQYDVPQIECPPASDGMERFACPTPDRQGRYHCIDDHVLCDGFIDCPSGEDEDRHDCMFYKTKRDSARICREAYILSNITWSRNSIWTRDGLSYRAVSTILNISYKQNQTRRLWLTYLYPSDVAIALR